MNLNISYNWLKEYIKTDKSVKEFVKEFSLKSQTIDKIEKVKPKFKKVITAKILEIKPHPDADRLQLVKLEAGRLKPTVVCGAQNIAVGQIVPLAVEGARVQNPKSDEEGTFFRVKNAKIRGVQSKGMICSQKELGLGDDHQGIMILPNKTPLGKPLEDILDLDDNIMDIEVTSNRPDAMSIVGLAREAAAVLGTKLKYKIAEPKLDFEKEIGLSVEVVEQKLCSRYNAIVMTDVKVGPSPLWLQQRLLSAGKRPINNLVDITNYILLELGQPMHVFDYAKISAKGGSASGGRDKKIVVRKAKQGEKVLALDGNVYKLNNNHLVIADGNIPIAIAGIMGGEKSAVSDKTKTIVFEAATFDPVLTRQSARDLNLHSDSSNLFEKGLHPEATFPAILKAVELTKKIAGGKVAGPLIDVYPTTYKPTTIKFDPTVIKNYLGVDIATDQVISILESLDFKVSGSKILNITVPFWRANDVKLEHDIIEEIARIFGYHNLPVELPAGVIPVEKTNQIFYWEDKIKDFFVSLGFSESYNYSMVSKEQLQKVKFSVKEAIKIYNPLNEDMEYMRTTLLPQVLQNIADNIKKFPAQKSFELSSVYVSQDNNLPQELLKLTAAISGDNVFLTAKGIVELLISKLKLSNRQFNLTDSKCPLWEKELAFDIYLGKDYLGQFGIFKRNIAEKFGIKRDVAVIDIDFNTLIKKASAVKTFEPIPEFPSVSRDIALVVDQKLSWEEVSSLVVKADKLIVNVQYLSTFIDQSLGKGKKSLALRMIFRSGDKTLKSEEVDDIVKKVAKKLEKTFEAKLR